MDKCHRLVTLLLLIGAPLALADDDHERARRLMQSGRIMPMEQLLDRASGEHDWSLLEIELEEEHGRLIYEIEWLDAQGRVHEIEYDAVTGQPLGSEDGEER